jgi:hypothetical protein
MPPKKDTGNGDGKLLTSFEDRETKLLAAAFVSCIGPDKVSNFSYRGPAFALRPILGLFWMRCRKALARHDN